MKNNMYICSAKPLIPYLCIGNNVILSDALGVVSVGNTGIVLTVSQKQGGNALLFSVAQTF